MIQAAGIFHDYFRGTPWEKRVLKDVNVKVGRGELVVLFGPSGAGKTTLIRILAGLLPPTRGSVRIDGRELYQKRERLARPEMSLGFVHQNPERYFFNATVMEELCWGADNRIDMGSRSTIKRVCADLGLDIAMLGERSPFSLSTGEQRKVALATFFVKNPDILILDEPFVCLSAEDVQRVVGMLEGMKKRRKTILIVTHKLDMIRTVADRLICIEGGSIVFDDPSDNFHNPCVP